MKATRSIQAADQPETTGAIADTAGEWLLRRQSGLTVAEEAELRAWLAADGRHPAALAELERTWRELNQPRERGLAGLAMTSLARRRQRRIRRRTFYTLSVAGAAVAIFLMFGPLPSQTPPTAVDLSQVVAIRPDLQTLPDGSTVELNAGADFSVVFSPEKRMVRLVRGEALFTVVKDAARPFVVSAGIVEVRAVGTAFSVRNDPAEIKVLVTEGRVAVERVADTGVAVSRSAPPDEPLILEVGRRVTVPVALPADAPLQVNIATAPEIEQALAWRGKRIEFSATPLSDVLAVFNRQNELRLTTADAATGQLEISGIFWADDPEGFVRLVETGLNLKTDRSENRIVLRRK